MRLAYASLLCSSILTLTLAQTNTSTAWPPYSPTAAPIFQLSADSQFAFYLGEAMSLSNTGGANSGEILRIATGIVPHDFESVYTSFYFMAERINGLAESIDVKLDPVGAREAYYRAATYYRGAVFFLLGNQSDPRIYSIWDQALTAFNAANALLPIPGERFTVKTYSENIGDYEAIGVFYRASHPHPQFCTNDTGLPTILIGTGYDGSQEEVYHQACVSMLARGINCVTFEGPGQPTVVRKQHIGFIPDWWTTVSPIMGLISARPDVDTDKIALVGVSFGGSLAPIAASRDNRFSAVVAIDGLVSMQEAVMDQLPDSITGLYNASNATAFDAVMEYIQHNATYPSELRWLIDQSLFAFNTTSPYDWFTRLGNISLTPEMVKNISAPVFVGRGQDDTLTLDQPEMAYGVLSTGRPDGEALTYFHQFNVSTGAGEHCHLGAESQLWVEVLRWLSGVWGNYTFAN